METLTTVVFEPRNGERNNTPNKCTETEGNSQEKHRLVTRGLKTKNKSFDWMHP